MRYRFTREVGVFIPPQSRLWLPSGQAEWIRAPEEVLHSILHRFSETIGTAKSPDRVVIAHENEFFISQARLWYRTAWTSSPVAAALYDRELDNALEIFFLSLDEATDKIRLITHRENAAGRDLAAPEENYTASAENPTRALPGDLVKEEGFMTRVLLPYLAVRRALISYLAFRPGTLQAKELACAAGTDHLKCLVCHGCVLPCSAVLRLHSVGEDTEQIPGVVVNLGDDYRFGRLTAATLANTSLLFYAAANGFFEDVDLTLTDPLKSINGFAVAPFTYRALLRDGRRLAAMEIMSPIMSRIDAFMIAAESRDEELTPIIRAVLSSNRWMPGTRNDRQDGSSGVDP